MLSISHAKPLTASIYSASVIIVLGNFSRAPLNSHTQDILKIALLRLCIWLFSDLYNNGICIRYIQRISLVD